MLIRIGGIKEKLIGALTAGVKAVVLPAANKKDVKELPEEVKAGLEIIFVKYVFIPRFSCWVKANATKASLGNSQGRLAGMERRG